MSRKGKVPIKIPAGVEVKFNEKAVNVKGPKGAMTQDLIPPIHLEVVDGQVLVSLKEQYLEYGNFWGLYRTLIENMIIGTSTGFVKELELVGVGYRAAVKGKDLSLSLGFSHPTEMPIPEGLTVEVERNTLVKVSGVDKQKVGAFAAYIRSKRPPEPYKGKGVKYVGEQIRRKAGKSGKGK